MAVVRFPAEKIDSSLLHSIQTTYGAHPASYTMDISVSFSNGRGVKCLGHEADNSPPSSPKVKNSWAIPPLPRKSSWHRDNFTVFYLYVGYTFVVLTQHTEEKPIKIITLYELTLHQKQYRIKSSQIISRVNIYTSCHFPSWQPAVRSMYKYDIISTPEDGDRNSLGNIKHLLQTDVNDRLI
jgi:hypothetical protein